MIVRVKVDKSLVPMPDFVSMDGTAAYLVARLVQALLLTMPIECSATEHLDTTLPPDEPPDKS